jgi:hypothetical protein
MTEAFEIFTLFGYIREIRNKMKGATKNQYNLCECNI